MVSTSRAKHLVGGVDERADDRDARVVVHGIDGPQFGFDPIERVPHRGGVGDVGTDGDDACRPCARTSSRAVRGRRRGGTAARRRRRREPAPRRWPGRSRRRRPSRGRCGRSSRSCWPLPANGAIDLAVETALESPGGCVAEIPRRRGQVVGTLAGPSRAADRTRCRNDCPAGASRAAARSRRP